MTNSWEREDKQSKIGKYFLYLFWPFGAWLYSLKDPRTKSSYIIFFLFAILLLWHMSSWGGASYDDFVGILDVFNNTNLTTNEFWEEVVAFFTFSDNAPKELYQDFLIWFTKLFTNNYHFMFLFAAIPVAILQLKSLRLVTGDPGFYPGIYAIIAMMAIILPRDMITVQNPRFSTGVWVFVFCSLYYFSEKKPLIKYVIPFLLLPVLHAGMWFALIIVAIFLIIPKNKKVLELLAIVSIPFVFFDPQILPYMDFNFLPSNISDWAELYTSEEAYDLYILHSGKAGYYWVGRFFALGLKLIYIIMAIQVIGNKQAVANSKEGQAFYPFFLFSFFMINMIQFIPEMGNRYYAIWRIFVFFMWYKTFHFSRPRVYWFLLVFFSWNMLFRYGYVLGGALSVNTPPDIFIAPLPYLIGKGLFW